MNSIHVGTTILSAIAWGCALNIIVAPSIAEKEDLAVPEIVYSSNFRVAGIVGILVSMLLAYLSAGWWGLVIVPAGGMLFGGISIAVLRETMIAISVPAGVLANLCCAIWLYFIF